MGFPILVRCHLYIESGPRTQSCDKLDVRERLVAGLPHKSIYKKGRSVGVIIFPISVEIINASLITRAIEYRNTTYANEYIETHKGVSNCMPVARILVQSSWRVLDVLTKHNAITVCDTRRALSSVLNRHRSARVLLVDTQPYCYIVL